MIKKKIDKALRKAFHDAKSPTYRVVNDILAVVILAAVILIILESVDFLRSSHRNFFVWGEAIIFLIFTFEYLIYVYLEPKKMDYIFSFFGIIDLLGFLPTLLSFFFLPFAALRPLRVLRIVRVLRLLRLLRLLKLISYSKRRHPEIKVFLKDIPWYNIEIFFFTLFSVVVVSGTFMFLVEGDEIGSQFVNIPQSMWWAVVTLTTVGYGDMIPQTVGGKFIAVFTMMAGLVLFALLVTVVGKVMQKILFGHPLEILNGEEKKKIGKKVNQKHIKYGSLSDPKSEV